MLLSVILATVTEGWEPDRRTEWLNEKENERAARRAFAQQHGGG